jgi:hypothetical protein
MSKMKQKSIAILFLVSTLSIYVNAQEKHHDAVRIALRAGVFSSHFKVQSSYDASFTGDDAFYAGIQVQIPIAPKLYISPEFLYAISSVTIHDNQLTGSIVASDYLSHVLIPVQLKYQAGNLGLYAGVQTELLVNASNAVTGIYKDKNVTDSSYKKVSFSAIAGAEFVFKYRFGIDVRYHHSLSNMRASNGSTFFTDNGSIKLNGLQAGIFFRFGRKPKKN